MLGRAVVLNLGGICGLIGQGWASFLAQGPHRVLRFSTGQDERLKFYRAFVCEGSSCASLCVYISPSCVYFKVHFVYVIVICMCMCVLEAHI